MCPVFHVPVLLSLSPLWRQDYECPRDAGNTRGFNQVAIFACTSGTTADSLEAYCCVPDGASVSSSGTPSHPVSDLGVYPSKSFTGSSSNEPPVYQNHRGMNYPAVNRAINPIHGKLDVVFIHGDIGSGATTSTLTMSGSGWEGGGFHKSATFLTDPPWDTYVLPTTAYPTAVGGTTFDWAKTSLVTRRDRNAALKPS